MTSVRKKYVLAMLVALSCLGFLVVILMWHFGRTGGGGQVRHWRAKRCAEKPGPPLEVKLGEPFLLRCRESARLKEVDLGVTIEDVDYSPMQSINGVELWPSSLFDFTLRCGTKIERRNAVARGTIGCGHQLKLVKIDREDDATWVMERGP